jgi:hypothetical protein
VLLVALGLLVLSATLLVSIGRAAVDHALRARRAEAELQRRWSVVSARVAVLAGADETLTRLEQEVHRPLPVYRTTVRLGDETLELILSDEQAKANVNALIGSAGRGDAETRLREAIAGSGLTNAVMLRPGMAPPPDRSGGLARFVDGFGQMFDRVAPQQLTGVGERSPANVLTCWGDGAINVVRASRPSLALAAGGQINEVAIGRLMKARDAAYAPPEQARMSLAPRRANDEGDGQPVSRSGDAVSSLLSRARIDGAVRGRVAMTGRSTCHSLWVIATSPTGRRQYSLFVLDESVGGERQVRSFAW